MTVLGVTALYIIGTMILRFLSDLAEALPRTSKVGKVIDVATRRERFTYNNIPTKVLRTVETVEGELGQRFLTTTQNMLLFAKEINAISADYNGDVPQHLAFVFEKKALYELERKYGHGYSSLLPKPTISKEELLRPLGDVEVLRFHNFCKEKPLINLEAV